MTFIYIAIAVGIYIIVGGICYVIGRWHERIKTQEIKTVERHTLGAG